MEINEKRFALSSRLKKFCQISLPISVFVFAVATYFALQQKTQFYSWELPIFEALNQLTNSLRVPVLVATTILGGVWAFVGAFVIVTLLKAYRLAWWLTFSVFVTYALTFIAKTVVARERPEQLDGSTIIRAVEQSYGFPSGHTAMATILSLTLFFYLPKGWRWTIVVLWIAIVAFTRVYLGVHSPLDIIGGVAIGLAVFTAIRLLPDTVKNFLRLRSARQDNTTRT